uniref:Fibronectin type-III domain-containing protein n=1 Tax=Plectus sambesii TaxID=2011161 RepID=A0A914VWW5_9BILA
MSSSASTSTTVDFGFATLLLFVILASPLPLATHAAANQSSLPSYDNHTKCSIVCFANCARNHVNKTDCICKEDKRLDCAEADKLITTADTITSDFPVDTVYKDARTITISTAKLPNAFAYIFEFAPISSSTWAYAGASTTPSATFVVPDPCLQYQFRLMIVSEVDGSRNSSSLQSKILSLPPRNINQTTPDFVLDTAQIQDRPPVYSPGDETVTAVVEWRLPYGYTAADIKGYASPAAYPLDCLTPEGDLPLPKPESLADGGRLRLVLPATILHGRCRLLIEVKMIPRCDRLTPFTIQRPLELDCNTVPSVAFCRQELEPKCTEIVDVWGDNGTAKVMWQEPENNGRPLYYHIRYGPSKVQGVPPFVAWRMSNQSDVKVNGNETTINLELRQNADYGIQICAVYNERKRRPKFGLVTVTPFSCSFCAHGKQGDCECGKIEKELSRRDECVPGLPCAPDPARADIPPEFLQPLRRPQLPLNPADAVDVIDDMVTANVKESEISPPTEVESRKANVNASSGERCFLSTGIVCHFGCDQENNHCICPPKMAVAQDGSCWPIVDVEQSSDNSSQAHTPPPPAQPSEFWPASYCIRSNSDLEMAVDNGMLRILCKPMADILQTYNGLDSIFVQFGLANRIERQTESSGAENEVNLGSEMETVEFRSDIKLLMAVVNRTENNRVFLDESYKILVGPLDLTSWYGLRLCLFSSRFIKNPKTTNKWHETYSSGYRISAASIVPLFFGELPKPTLVSPFAREEARIAFEHQRRLKLILTISVPVAALTILGTILAVIIYFNWTKIRRYLDRRRTRSFSPFTGLDQQPRTPRKTAIDSDQSLTAPNHYAQQQKQTFVKREI